MNAIHKYIFYGEMIIGYIHVHGINIALWNLVNQDPNNRDVIFDWTNPSDVL